MRVDKEHFKEFTDETILSIIEEYQDDEYLCDGEIMEYLDNLELVRVK